MKHKIILSIIAPVIIGLVAFHLIHLLPEIWQTAASYMAGFFAALVQNFILYGWLDNAEKVLKAYALIREVETNLKKENDNA